MDKPYKPPVRPQRKVLTFRAEQELYDQLVAQTHLERCTLSELLVKYAQLGLLASKGARTHG